MSDKTNTPEKPAQDAPSKSAPAPKSTVQSVGETIVDLVSIIGVIALAYVGKVNGELALAVVGVLAGVRVTDLVSARNGAGPGAGGAGGLAGLVMLLSHAGGSTAAQSGFVRARTLRSVAVATAASLVLLPVLGALLAGCPLPAVDGCTPLDTQCTPEGVPQSCSPTQRWTSGALQRPCSQRAAGAVCCRTRSPYGRELHACVPRGACIPETSAADAGAEGGEQ